MSSGFAIVKNGYCGRPTLRSNVSRLLILGWTQEVPDFAEAVQPVQGVQPKIQLSRNSLLRMTADPPPALCGGDPSHNRDSPKWLDRLDRLDGANSDGHFSRPRMLQRLDRLVRRLDAGAKRIAAPEVSEGGSRTPLPHPRAQSSAPIP